MPCFPGPALGWGFLIVLFGMLAAASYTDLRWLVVPKKRQALRFSRRASSPTSFAESSSDPAAMPSGSSRPAPCTELWTRSFSPSPDSWAAL